MQEQIGNRMGEVKRLGAYIGAFELVAWGALEQVKVCLVIGGSVYDIRAIYGADIPAPPASAPVHYFVACRTGARGILFAVDTHKPVPVFNHYVIGVPLPGHEHGSLDPVRGDSPLRVICARLGFAVVETQRAGDCGIDVMCFHKKYTRDSATFKKLRASLAAFVLARSLDPAWQQCFRACGEACGPVPLDQALGRRNPAMDQESGRAF